MSQGFLCLRANIKLICITPSCYSSHRFTIKHDVIRSHGKLYGRKAQYWQPYLWRVYEIVDKGQERSWYNVIFTVFRNIITSIHMWEIFEAYLNRFATNDDRIMIVMFLKFWNLHLDHIVLKKQWTLSIFLLQDITGFVQ